jgi:hypothetical protein
VLTSYVISPVDREVVCLAFIICLVRRATKVLSGIEIGIVPSSFPSQSRIVRTVPWLREVIPFVELLSIQVWQNQDAPTVCGVSSVVLQVKRRETPVVIMISI